MKTTKLQQLVFILVSAMVLTFTSCAKDNLDLTSADPSSLEQFSADENNVENVLKDVESDVTSVMSDKLGNFKSLAWMPCNAKLDTISITKDTLAIRITFNGLTCNNKRNRTGTIELKTKLGTKWNDKGAAVVCKFIDFTVTNVGSDKSAVKLNGTKTMVNVNGGHRWQVGTTLTSYVERITGSMKASFDNGTSRTWNVARQITYTGKTGQYILTIDGFGSEGDYKNLLVWGTNRLGEVFFTEVKQSVVCKQTCDWDPISGIKIHQIPSGNKSATITFGYNDKNEPIVAEECPTRYRIDWQRENKSGTSYRPL